MMRLDDTCRFTLYNGVTPIGEVGADFLSVKQFGTNKAVLTIRGASPLTQWLMRCRDDPVTVCVERDTEAVWFRVSKMDFTFSGGEWFSESTLVRAG